MDTAEFATGVLLPLATGGTLVVRGPIDAKDVAELIEERRSMPGLAEVAAARQGMFAHFLYDAEAPPLDEDAIKIAAAVHNLCFLLGQDRYDEQKGTLHRVAAFTARLAALPPPEDEQALLGRHALVGKVRTLCRRDVRVRFWAGHREYRGESPPRRLLRWQSLRRVREEHTTVDLFAEALAIPSARAIVAALLTSSPLTDLLGIERVDPLVDLRSAARWLRAPVIARALADDYLRRSLPGIEGPFAAALMVLYNQKAADAAATATCFHSHLHLLDLIARPSRDREGHLQVLRGYVQGRERTVADGFGLHAAADRVGLGRPRDLVRDAVLSRNADAYAEACAELVGPRRLAELTGLLTRGAGPHARVS